MSIKLCCNCTCDSRDKIKRINEDSYRRGKAGSWIRGVEECLRVGFCRSGLGERLRKERGRGMPPRGTSWVAARSGDWPPHPVPACPVQRVWGSQHNTGSERTWLGVVAVCDSAVSELTATADCSHLSRQDACDARL